MRHNPALLKIIIAVFDLYNEAFGPVPADWTEAIRWAHKQNIITAGEHSAVLAGTPLP